MVLAQHCVLPTASIGTSTKHSNKGPLPQQERKVVTVEVFVLACTGDAAQDEANMQSMVQAVLDVAAQAGVTTLAMPLLGAGLAQWPVVPTAKAHVAKVLAAAYCRPGGTRLKVRSFASL